MSANPCIIRGNDVALYDLLRLVLQLDKKREAEASLEVETILTDFRLTFGQAFRSEELELPKTVFTATHFLAETIASSSLAIRELIAVFFEDKRHNDFLSASSWPCEYRLSQDYRTSVLDYVDFANFHD